MERSTSVLLVIYVYYHNRRCHYIDSECTTYFNHPVVAGSKWNTASGGINLHDPDCK